MFTKDYKKILIISFVGITLIVALYFGYNYYTKGVPKESESVREEITEETERLDRLEKMANSEEKNLTKEQQKFIFNERMNRLIDFSSSASEEK